MAPNHRLPKVIRANPAKMTRKFLILQKFHFA